MTATTDTAAGRNRRVGEATRLLGGAGQVKMALQNGRGPPAGRGVQSDGDTNDGLESDIGGQVREGAGDSSLFPRCSSCGVLAGAYGNQPSVEPVDGPC